MPESNGQPDQRDRDRLTHIEATVNRIDTNVAEMTRNAREDKKELWRQVNSNSQRIAGIEGRSGAFGAVAGAVTGIVTGLILWLVNGGRP